MLHSSLLNLYSKPSSSPLTLLFLFFYVCCYMRCCFCSLCDRCERSRVMLITIGEELREMVSFERCEKKMRLKILNMWVWSEKWLELIPLIEWWEVRFIGWSCNWFSWSLLWWSQWVQFVNSLSWQLAFYFRFNYGIG